MQPPKKVKYQIPKGKPNTNVKRLPSDNTSTFVQEYKKVDPKDRPKEPIQNVLNQTILDQFGLGKSLNTGNEILETYNNDYLNLLNRGLEVTKLRLGPMGDLLTNTAQEVVKAVDETVYKPEFSRLADKFRGYKNGGEIDMQQANVPKYKYVNGKFIPTHAFGDTKVGAGIKNGNMIAPALNIAQGFTDENTNPMLSEALNYGAQGASMGAMFGPWGAAIGGGVGLLGGAVKGYFDKEEQDAKQAQFEQTKRNQLAYASLMGKADNSNLGIKTNTQSLYAQGGLKTISRNHPNPQEEVEGGESAITPNGQNIQFKGPKHNNGGIKTNLPSGTRIFSDRLIYPGK